MSAAVVSAAESSGFELFRHPRRGDPVDLTRPFFQWCDRLDELVEDTASNEDERRGDLTIASQSLAARSVELLTRDLKLERSCDRRQHLLDTAQHEAHEASLRLVARLAVLYAQRAHQLTLLNSRRRILHRAQDRAAFWRTTSHLGNALVAQHLHERLLLEYHLLGGAFGREAGQAPPPPPSFEEPTHPAPPYEADLPRYADDAVRRPRASASSSASSSSRSVHSLGTLSPHWPGTRNQRAWA